MTVTMRDVARRSGVSIATVSNVLHHTAPVADSTRQRVMESIHELDYRQNEVARSLKRRATKTLGVVIPDALNPFHATIALEVDAGPTATGLRWWLPRPRTIRKPRTTRCAPWWDDAWTA